MLIDVWTVKVMSGKFQVGSMDNWNGGDLCYILAKKLSTFCSCLKTDGG